MLKIIAAIAILLFPTGLYAQLFTLSDNYVHHALVINPAFSGSRDALETTMLYRNYLSGFEGSPRTMSLSAHASLGHERIGLGFYLISDQIGISKVYSFMGNYAYRMNVGRAKLALGLGIGFTSLRDDWKSLAVQDAGDDLLSSNFTTGILPDFSFGIYYSGKKYFMGLSIPMFLSHEYSVAENRYKVRNDFRSYTYFYSGGYTFEFDRQLKLQPSILVKYQHGNATQIDLGSRIIFKDCIGLGVIYRSTDSLAGMLDCQVNSQIRLGYSYDFTVGRNAAFRYNAHEIMLNYVFVYALDVTGPRQF